MKLEPSDLGYFTMALEHVASWAEGFAPSDIAFVPWAWQIIDGRINFYGWVAELHDGRRIYIEYRVDEAGRGKPEGLRLEVLRPGLERPELSDPAVYWLRPRHLNWALGLERR